MVNRLADATHRGPTTRRELLAAVRRDPWFRGATKELNASGKRRPVHGGSQVGVLRVLLNSFGRQRGDPATREMQSVVRRLGRFASELKKEHSARTLFEAHLFRLLVGGATEIAAEEGVIRP